MTETTYHGISKATCLECGYSSTDITELEMWNDHGEDCLKCEGGRTKWIVYGDVVISERDA